MKGSDLRGTEASEGKGMEIRDGLEAIGKETWEKDGKGSVI